MVFKIWFILYSTIAIYIYNVRPGFTKDEAHYLQTIEGASTVIGLFGGTEHFFNLIVLYGWSQLTNDAPIYLLNLSLIFFSCRYFIKSIHLNVTIFLFMLLPTAHYCATFLREPLLFSFVLFFLGSLLRKNRVQSLMLGFSIFPIRFYWSVVIVAYALPFLKSRIALAIMFVFALSIIILYDNKIYYVLNSFSKINFDTSNLVRVFFTPLPTLFFDGDVNLYENAILYTLIFPIKLVTFFVLMHKVIRFIYVMKLRIDESFIMVPNNYIARI